MKIILDAGHGGDDPGGRSLGLSEKIIVTEFQPFLWKALAELGHCCVPTRVADVTVPLGERSRFANMLGGDCFLSIHANASTNVKARGFWTIYAAPSQKGRALADSIHREVSKVAVSTSPAAVYPDGDDWTGGRTLHVLRKTTMPAIILELGFMTNLQDYKLLTTPSYCQRLATAIAAGVSFWTP